MSTKYHWCHAPGIYELIIDEVLVGRVVSDGAFGWTWYVFSRGDSLVQGLSTGDEFTREEAMKRVEEYLDLVDI